MRQGSKVHKIFIVLAALWLIASFYHLHAIFRPELRLEYPWGRHLFWVIAGLIGSYFLLHRTVYFIPVLIALVAQQFSGHGVALATSISAGEAIALIDLLAVLFAPIVCILYCADVMQSRKASCQSSLPDRRY